MQCGLLSSVRHGRFSAVPSPPPLGSAAPLQMLGAQRAAVSQALVAEAQPIAVVATSFWTNVKARPYLATAFVLLTLTLALSYRLFIRRITALSGSLSGSNAMRLWPTIQGVCYTICSALPVWLALTAISWLLGHYAEPESTESSFADALGATALVFLPLEILRQLIRPHGIATAHFGWPELVIKPLGQAVRRFGWIGLTLVFLATFLLLERFRLNVQAGLHLAFIQINFR